MRKIKELIIEKSLLSSALVTIAVTIGIVLVLALEAYLFFKEVSIFDFFTDTQWTPLYTEKHYGILPLLSGTLLTTFIAISVAMPIGLSISIYLSEYAPRSFRKTIKP
ncbi:MAG: phosphate ABC transporter permease subunit PstC, partial [Lutibacter sp.]|nr:phosphate ABC transporter permease subunit PstC [Lutibacter sp.]